MYIIMMYLIGPTGISLQRSTELILPLQTAINDIDYKQFKQNVCID